MIVNSIKLKNFRSFEDEAELVFNTDADKNIVLIGGENGAGKSTIFEAIKLCIYGPISYGYQGSNSIYLSKIKSNINNNSFQLQNVESYIKVSLSLKEGIDINRYTLTRRWIIKDKKVLEDFSVSKNNKTLNLEETHYFEKYFKSILSPVLFDFFFFDGEELSDFFTGKNANSNLKDAVLELFNYDNFSILKKQLLSYQRSLSSSSSDLDELQKKYDNEVMTFENLKQNLSNFKNQLEEKTLSLENLFIQKEEIEFNFRNSGGMLEDERASLLANVNKLENERGEINQYIKDFANDTLPFLLITSLLTKTKKQIENEDKLSSYNTLKQNINDSIIKSAILNEISLTSVNDINFNNITNNIITNMFGSDDLSDIDSILGLSSDEKIKILSLINNICNKNDDLRNIILNKFNRLNEISRALKSLREKLNSSTGENALYNYLNDKNICDNSILSHETQIQSLELQIEKTISDISSAEYSLTRTKNQYTTAIQSNSTLDLSNNIINLLDVVLEDVSKDKIRYIEKEFLNIFNAIIRKDNYINDISIDDKFNCTLYIDKCYNKVELLNLLNNVSFEDLDKKYGNKFVENLYTAFNITNRRELLEKLNSSVCDKKLMLKTKIDVNGFSKGEKQIYILCLIWALIKTSKVDIPFIIDTPYARIDEIHRNSLTNVYLPNVSKQVIILSTNEEIDSNLYNAIKPHLCDEYLLIYNDTERKTEIKKGYFKV